MKPKFAVEFGKDGLPPAASDGRLDAPAYHRNHAAIWSVLSGFLSARTGHVLEIGSGTGQHIITYAHETPALTWWPSDIAASHLESIAAWQRATGVTNVRPVQKIDLMDDGWSWRGDYVDDKLTALLCFNVIHISPWRVTENLMRGAGRYLDKDGFLFTYGPYKRGGQHTAPSNADFDASLRERNPAWGVRDMDDVTALAKDNGLTLHQLIDMPSNNSVLVYRRQ